MNLKFEYYYAKIITCIPIILTMGMIKEGFKFYSETAIVISFALSALCITYLKLSKTIKHFLRDQEKLGEFKLLILIVISLLILTSLSLLFGFLQKSISHWNVQQPSIVFILPPILLFYLYSLIVILIQIRKTEKEVTSKIKLIIFSVLLSSIFFPLIFKSIKTKNRNKKIEAYRNDQIKLKEDYMKILNDIPLDNLVMSSNREMSVQDEDGVYKWTMGFNLKFNDEPREIHLSLINIEPVSGDVKWENRYPTDLNMDTINKSAIFELLAIMEKDIRYELKVTFKDNFGKKYAFLISGLGTKREVYRMTN